MVGEAKIVGMMGSIALTPDKVNRAQFYPLLVRSDTFVVNVVLPTIL